MFNEDFLLEIYLNILTCLQTNKNLTSNEGRMWIYSRASLGDLDICLTNLLALDFLIILPKYSPINGTKQYQITLKGLWFLHTNGISK